MSFLYLFFTRKIILLASLFSQIYLFINSFATALFAPLSGLSQYRSFQDEAKTCRCERSCGAILRIFHLTKLLPLFHQRTASFSFLAKNFSTLGIRELRSSHVLTGFRESVQSSIILQLPKIIFPLATIVTEIQHIY